MDSGSGSSVIAEGIVRSVILSACETKHLDSVSVSVCVSVSVSVES